MMIITPDRDYDGDQRVNDSADDKDYDPAPIVTPPPNHGLRRFEIKNSKPKLILNRNFMCFL